MAGKAILTLVLVSLSGLFSGLNLGLLSLDKIGLEVVISSGSPKEVKYAKAIYPVRMQGNLLLCTLLLGNVLVNSVLAIVQAGLFNPVYGSLVATALITIFGEIVPQSVCNRHGLFVGYYTIKIVKFFIALLFVVSWPIAKILDLILGEELGTIYQKKQLKKLMDIHSGSGGTDLTKMDGVLLAGALDFSQRLVGQIMTPIEDVVGLNVTDKLDFDTLTGVLNSGHSRIPVFGRDKKEIIGILVVKDLILIDPDQNTPVSTILTVSGREILKVFEDFHLDEMLNEFKSGRGHMAIVHRVNNLGEGDPVYENIGLVTLEDVIEALIQDDIIDETDVYVDVRTRKLVEHPEVGRRRSIEYRNLLFARRPRARGVRIGDQPSLVTEQQVRAICSYLAEDHAKLFAPDVLEPAILRKLIRSATLEIVEAPPPEGKGPPEDDKSRVIYERGVPSNLLTLLLSGALDIVFGPEGLETESGPWSILGLTSLEDYGESRSFKPEFTAVAKRRVEMVQITSQDYNAAYKASKVARISKRIPDEASMLGAGPASSSTENPPPAGTPLSSPQKSNL